MADIKKLFGAGVLAIATGLFAVGCASSDSAEGASSGEHPRGSEHPSEHPEGSEHPSEHPDSSEHPSEHPGR